MASKLYSRFVTILQRWPTDPTNKADLGKRLRLLLTETFPRGPTTSVANEAGLTKDLESLTRLSNNIYREKYPRSLTTALGATGLTKDILARATSEEVMVSLSDDKKSASRFDFLKKETE